MLCDLQSAKRWLGLTTEQTDDDVFITSLLSSSSAFIESCCNRSFTVSEHVVELDGNGRSALMLPDYPIVSVESVEVNGRAVNKGFRAVDYLIVLNADVFPKGLRNVKITYTAGFEAIPADLQHACMELVGLRYKERDRIGEQSKSLAGETVSFFIRDLSPTAQSVVNQYKRVVPI